MESRTPLSNRKNINKPLFSTKKKDAFKPLTLGTDRENPLEFELYNESKQCHCYENKAEEEVIPKLVFVEKEEKVKVFQFVPVDFSLLKIEIEPFEKQDEKLKSVVENFIHSELELSL